MFQRSMKTIGRIHSCSLLRMSSTASRAMGPKSMAKKGALFGAVMLGGIALATYSINQHRAECEFKKNQNHATEGILLGRNFVADVVEAISPAVVNILCLSTGYMSAGASSGSGFIINKEGYIVTNAHVVAPAADGRVIVTMTNGRKKAARVHSMDLLSDIAIVKLDDAHDDMLPTISFGDSSKVKSGEFVIAIGSPMHLQNSASFGIVSATARHASELGISNNRSEYIQTDAAINMGNSGGPLVNLDGHVIGINTMKVKGTDGISFAIPIDIAVQVINQLVANKRVIRPYVGLKMANMIPSAESQHANRQYRKRHSDILSTEETKVVVLDVVKGSPAHNCGIMSGDIIVEVNGKPVTAVKDVLTAIGLEVGRMVEFKLQRPGANNDYVQVTLTTAPELSRN